MLSNLLLYWMIAGIYCVIHGYIRSTFFMTKEKQEKIDKLCEKVNPFMSKDNLILISYGILLLFGGIILPLWMLEYLYKLITGKELIDIDTDI